MSTRFAGLGPLFDGLCGWVKSIPNNNAHLAKISCDHVDIQCHFPSNVPCKLIEWGTRLIEDFSLPENQLFSPSTDEQNVADETDHGEECEVQGCFSFVNLLFAICQW